MHYDIGKPNFTTDALISLSACSNEEQKNIYKEIARVSESIKSNIVPSNFFRLKSDPGTYVIKYHDKRIFITIDKDKTMFVVDVVGSRGG